MLVSALQDVLHPGAGVSHTSVTMALAQALAAGSAPPDPPEPALGLASPPNPASAAAGLISPGQGFLQLCKHRPGSALDHSQRMLRGEAFTALGTSGP